MPGERYLAVQLVEAGHGKWRPKFYLRRAFYIFSSLGKLYIRIDRGIKKKASKTAESCVETSDEEDNYDDDLSTKRRCQWRSSDKSNHGDELT